MIRMILFVCCCCCFVIVFCLFVVMVRLGGENLAVAQNTYSVMWFKGKELNMVFGLLLSVSRIVRGKCLEDM